MQCLTSSADYSASIMTGNMSNPFLMMSGLKCVGNAIRRSEMSLIELIFVLIMIHYLCDFSLQNDFVAKFKSMRINGEYNPIWYHCLTAHCAIHSLGVYVVTKSLWLTTLMFVTHFIIDQSKCLNKLTFNQDQLLHLVVIIVISFLFFSV